ncbi:MAG: hypothetical protein AAGA77_02565 [Bacteroidota bacterium]
MLEKITKSGTFLLLMLTFFISCTAKLHAQSDTTEIWRIKTVDGNEFVGQIVRQTETELTIKTQRIGTFSLLLTDIKQMDQVNKANIHGDEVWRQNRQESRYFVAPSAFGLKKGEGYYQNAWIVFNQLTYGVTDNFSIGAGTIPVFLFSGSSTPVWVTPKFSIPVEKNSVTLGAGAFIGSVLGEDEEFGVVYGTSTFGSPERNFTFGVGYGFVDGDFADSPAITMSGMIRAGKKAYLITENYLISTDNDTYGIMSVGGRRLWNNVALDFGGIIPIGDVDDFIIIPWLGIVFSFGS